MINLNKHKHIALHHAAFLHAGLYSIDLIQCVCVCVCAYDMCVCPSGGNLVSLPR